MDDLIRQATGILKGMWQHRWLGLAVAWLAAAAGAAVVLRIPDKYEASARIYVDTQSILKPLMSGLAAQPNVEQQIMILSRTLISRPNIEKLIRMADLDLEIKTKADRDELADRLMKTLEIGGTLRDNLFTLAYRDSDPERAKRVVQSLVSIFVESSLGSTRKDSAAARKFIDEQIRIYEKKLEDAESRLKDFKLRNVEMQALEGRSAGDRLADISAQLSQARLELREAGHSRDALKRHLLGEESPLPAAPEAGGGNPEIDARIDALKRNLDILLQRYTEQHPDVIGTRRVLAELEEQRRQNPDGRGKGPLAAPDAAARAGHPAFQPLKLAAAEAEARVASLQARVAEYESRYQRTTESMKTKPQIEAEFAQLNRDYDINKKNYEALVARRESATLGGDLESASGLADFRLIDPPRVSPRPVAPNRLLLLSLVFAAALGSGALAALAASQLRPVFFDSRSLQETTGMPLLGSVSVLELEADRHQGKRDRKRFLAVLGGLILAYGTGLAALFLFSSRAA